MHNYVYSFEYSYNMEQNVINITNYDQTKHARLFFQYFVVFVRLVIAQLHIQCFSFRQNKTSFSIQYVFWSIIIYYYVMVCHSRRQSHNAKKDIISQITKLSFCLKGKCMNILT